MCILSTNAKLTKNTLNVFSLFVFSVRIINANELPIIEVITYLSARRFGQALYTNFGIFQIALLHV